MAYVLPPRRGDEIACSISLWNQSDCDPAYSYYAGHVSLDRYGNAIECEFNLGADPYWKDMPWFGWLLDMAVDAGLELGEG
jgi:hypothetical protein